MKKKLFLGVVLSILAISLVVFILNKFVWQPSATRKWCVEQANNQKISQTRQNNFYRECLAKNGMKPESLFVNLK